MIPDHGRKNMDLIYNFIEKNIVIGIIIGLIVAGFMLGNRFFVMR